MSQSESIGLNLKPWPISLYHYTIWHKDFGDPEKELSILKDACTFLHEINPIFSYRLDCYEEGYIRVEVLSDEDVWGEIHVADQLKKKIGIFKKDGTEKYFWL